MTRIHWSRYLDVAGGLILIVLPPSLPVPNSGIRPSSGNAACTPAGAAAGGGRRRTACMPLLDDRRAERYWPHGAVPLLLMSYDLSRPVAFLVYTTTIVVVVVVTYTVPVR
jgi:hypothetical protein